MGTGHENIILFVDVGLLTTNLLVMVLIITSILWTIKLNKEIDWVVVIHFQKYCKQQQQYLK